MFAGTEFDNDDDNEDGGDEFPPRSQTDGRTSSHVINQLKSDILKGSTNLNPGPNN